MSRIMLQPYVATSPIPTDSRHLVFEDFGGAGIRVAERRFAAKDMIIASAIPTNR
jgi:hypothetical protein